MFKSSLLFLATATSSLAQEGDGILGFGRVRYNPVCAATCATVVSLTVLDCTNVKGHKHLNQLSLKDQPGWCLETNEPYLTTTAYCIQQHCEGESTQKLETFWATQVGRVTGAFEKANPPKWTYQEALANIEGIPSVTLVLKQPLNQTAIVPEAAYSKYKETFDLDVYYENRASLYSIVVVATVVAVPLVLSLAGSIFPTPTSLAARLKSVLITPAFIGRRNRVPAWGGLGLQPTRGIAILILYILIINFLVSVVDFPTVQPNVRYDTKGRQYKMGVGLRTGLLSFANMALVIFLAGRNTFLLWLTNWSRSTYLLIHRWVAYVAILQGAIHCLIYLQNYVQNNMYFMHAVMPFFIYGTVAMLAMTFLWAFSVLPIRQRWYEAFLIGHIVFSIITIVGCWYHVWTLYENLWGFEIWVYVCIAAWVADRTFRVLRIAKIGRKQATITAIDEDYLQIDVPDVALEGHAFLYFPSLSWKVWENHPFSIARSIYVAPQHADDSSSQIPVSESDISQDFEKYPVAKTKIVRDAEGTALKQLTFIIRAAKGTTAKLAARADQTIPVYIEGGYHKDHGSDLHPHVVAIAGGTGITAVLPILRKHPGRAKLYWGVRNERLVNHVRASGLLDGIEVAEVSVGARLDIVSILETEIDGRIKDPVVVVSGPASMADDVRASTVAVVRKTGVNVKFLDEAFSW